MSHRPQPARPTPRGACARGGGRRSRKHAEHGKQIGDSTCSPVNRPSTPTTRPSGVSSRPKFRSERWPARSSNSGAETEDPPFSCVTPRKLRWPPAGSGRHRGRRAVNRQACLHLARGAERDANSPLARPSETACVPVKSGCDARAGTSRLKVNVPRSPASADRQTRL